MPLTGLMRVRDEGRWLERAIRSILPVCDRVYVMDDHSTDNTRDIAYELGCVVLRSPFSDLDEARDNTWLLDAAMARIQAVETGPLSCHWFMHLDGDEEVLASDRGKLNSDLYFGTTPQYCVQILYLWDDEKTVRVDGHYSTCYRPSLFRALKHGMTYKNHSGKIHSTGVPQDIGYAVKLHEPEPVRVLHYGYMDERDRVNKFERYVKIDPGMASFYETECLGPAVTKPLAEVLR